MLLLFAIGLLKGYAQDNLQGEIFGTISDQRYNQPLAGATVRILESDLGAISDTAGRFLLPSLEVGIYTIEVSFLGFLPKVISNVTVLPQKQTELNVNLEENGILLSSFEVASYRFENDRSKPISTFSFSRDEIALNPGAQGDIFRAIGMLPGVTSSGGIYSAIAVRGQGVRDNVYMVDDIPLTEVGHLEGNSFFNDPNGGRFSIFAPRVVDNALFQGGAFGAEYGRRSASFLGLSLKEGNAANPIFDGQIDLLGANVNYDGPSGFHDATTLFISARYQNFYPLVNLVGIAYLGLPSYGDLLVKTSTKIKDKHKLNLLLILSPERFVRTIDHLKEDDALNLLYLPDFRRNKTVGGLNLKSQINNATTWKNILYYTNYTSNVNVGKAYPVANESGELRTTNFPFRNSIQSQYYAENKFGYRSVLEGDLSKDLRFITGVEADVLHLYNDRELLVNDTNFIFRRTHFSADSNLNFQVITPELVNADFDDFAWNASAFTNVFFTIGDRLSGQIGLRWDYSGFSKEHVLAPRTNFSYHLHANHSFSVGLGLFYQDPVYSDIADLPENQTLELERVGQVILSYKGYLKKDIKVMLEGWYKHFDNLIVTPISGSVFRNNNGQGEGCGIDFSLTKRISRGWHGIASYSYMNVLRNDNDGNGFYPFTFSQPHQAIVMLSYEFNARLSVSGKYRVASGRPTDAFIIHSNVLNDLNRFYYSMELIGRNEDRLPYFSSLDLRLNYNFYTSSFKGTVFFDVVNVLNRQIANNVGFNPVFGNIYYDGLAIFPTAGFKFEF